MRKIGIGLGVVAGLALAWWAVEMVAAESGEVVVLRTADPEGQLHETRLWVVDHQDAVWLRAGHGGSSWFRDLERNPSVQVERGGETLDVRAVPMPGEQAAINARMAEKYGWAESYIGFFFSRDSAIPIRLEPRP